MPTVQDVINPLNHTFLDLTNVPCTSETGFRFSDSSRFRDRSQNVQRRLFESPDHDLSFEIDESEELPSSGDSYKPLCSSKFSFKSDEEIAGEQVNENNVLSEENDITK